MNAQAIGLLLASLCANCALSGLAWGQTGAAQPAVAVDVKPIGKVLEATGVATVEHTSSVLLQANIPASGPGQVKVDDLVYQGDVVQTGANGALSITFVDGTSFKVSSNARMELNELVYDPKSNSNSMVFSLAKGSFTFLAGMVAAQVAQWHRGHTDLRSLKHHRASPGCDRTRRCEPDDSPGGHARSIRARLEIRITPGSINDLTTRSTRSSDRE